MAQILIASLEVPKWRWQMSMSVIQHVLETVKGKTVHFPRMVTAGRVGRVSATLIVDPTKLSAFDL